MRRMSSLDRGYVEGNLSVFPRAKDSKFTLYEVANNAESELKQTLSTNGKYIIVNDASKFPDFGLAKISNNTEHTEVLWYSRKIGNQLHDLHRGFGENKQYTWGAGSKISCPVMAEHHNALRDAILKIQKKIGLLTTPDADSLNGVLSRLERRWLAPKPVFKAYPRQGKPPLKVHFHNFSNGQDAKFLWEFGDGSTSTEANPDHTFVSSGKYTVKLSMMSIQGTQAVAEKNDYINVNFDADLPVFYVEPADGISIESANHQNIPHTVFTFIDQTEGDVSERHWYFGDGKDKTVSNHNIHTVNYSFEKPGTYKPTLVLRMENNNIIRPILMREVKVI